jgi:hypothetical protein
LPNTQASGRRGVRIVITSYPEDRVEHRRHDLYRIERQSEQADRLFFGGFGNRQDGGAPDQGLGDRSQRTHPIVEDVAMRVAEHRQIVKGEDVARCAHRRHRVARSVKEIQPFEL